MTSSGFAVRTENIGKRYEIYDRPHDRLKQSLWRGRKKFHRDFWALRNVSFEVKKGETFGIVGRNGSGKSTLLQMICGTLTPTEGQIEVNGRVAALLELGSGFNPEFTGRENVYLNASVLGLSKEEIDSKYDEIVQFADIGDFIDQPVKTYSSGMQVRLAFSVIAHVDADILVIDEALAVGDVFFTQKCMRFLHEFQDKGGTILFVSHDMSAVKALCNVAILLPLGSQKQPILGSVEEISRIYLEEIYAERSRPLPSEGERVHIDNGVGSKSLQSISASERIFDGEDGIPNVLHVSPLRHDAESLGAGGARIINAGFMGDDGRQLSTILGGERVCFSVLARALRPIRYPAFGFVIKDRLGQYVCAEGTDFHFRDSPIVLNKDELATAEFSFTMPILIQGDYTVTVAIAEGQGEEHFQHHLMHDAIAIKSIQSRLVHGIVGACHMRMKIRIEKADLKIA